MLLVIFPFLDGALELNEFLAVVCNNLCKFLHFLLVRKVGVIGGVLLCG